MRLIEITTEIDNICEEYGIQDYTINDNGTIDVDGNVHLEHQEFSTFPLRFNKVTGDFICTGCENLYTLKDGPDEVGGGFDCSGCESLETLQYSPTFVHGYFDCSGCSNLTSLKGAPSVIPNYFACSDCPKLTSFEHAPLQTGNFYAGLCFGITTLSHVRSIKERIGLDGTPVMNMLFLFKIKNLRVLEASDKDLVRIINKHLAGNRDIMECQEELIEAGLGRYARLK